MSFLPVEVEPALARNKDKSLGCLMPVAKRTFAAILAIMRIDVLTLAGVFDTGLTAQIRRCYERHLSHHSGFGGKLIAKNIIAHKLALVCFHILREGTRYEEKRLFGN